MIDIKPYWHNFKCLRLHHTLYDFTYTGDYSLLCN